MTSMSTKQVAQHEPQPVQSIFEPLKTRGVNLYKLEDWKDLKRISFLPESSHIILPFAQWTESINTRTGVSLYFGNEKEEMYGNCGMQKICIHSNFSNRLKTFSSHFSFQLPLVKTTEYKSITIETNGSPSARCQRTLRIWECLTLRTTRTSDIHLRVFAVVCVAINRKHRIYCVFCEINKLECWLCLQSLAIGSA